VPDEHCPPGEHEFKPSSPLAAVGWVTEQCTKCPCWRTRWVPPTRTSRIENTRRSMEETSRYLGEHRDV
jgi:hypothetical protein